MARNSRLIDPGLSYHITQRGTNREDVFFSIQDRETYLARLRANLGDAGVRVLAYCLMTNHVHLVLAPKSEGRSPPARTLPIRVAQGQPRRRRCGTPR